MALYTVYYIQQTIYSMHNLTINTNSSTEYYFSPQQHHRLSTSSTSSKEQQHERHEIATAVYVVVLCSGLRANATVMLR